MLAGEEETGLFQFHRKLGLVKSRQLSQGNLPVCTDKKISMAASVREQRLVRETFKSQVLF